MRQARAERARSRAQDDPGRAGRDDRQSGGDEGEDGRDGPASRKKIEELKFAREELKDTLIRSPDSSIVVLRKHPELIAAIGGTEFVDRVEDRKKSLASSLSAPHLSRPATTGGSPSAAIKPLEGFDGAGAEERRRAGGVGLERERERERGAWRMFSAFVWWMYQVY